MRICNRGKWEGWKEERSEKSVRGREDEGEECKHF